MDNSKGSLSVIDFLVHSSLYRAASGFCGAAIAGAALGARFDPLAYMIPTLIVLAGYTLDNLYGMKNEGDKINQPARHRYFQQYWRISLVVACVSLAVVVILCFRKSLLLGIFLIAVPVVATGLYSQGWKRFFPKAKHGRLKDITFIKPTIVGLLWGVMLVIAPALYLGLPWSLWLFLVYIYISWRNAFNSIVFDVADVEGDQQSGTRTLPIVWGVRNTLLALAAGNALSLVWVALMNGIPWAAQFALYAGIFYAFGCLYLVTRVHDRKALVLIVTGQHVITYLVYLFIIAIRLVA